MYKMIVVVMMCVLVLQQSVELPDSFSKELRGLLEALLVRDIDKRLGCKGRGYVPLHYTILLQKH
jgi:hypothetical protein